MSARALSRVEQAQLRLRLVQAYVAGSTSRRVAADFGVSGQMVREAIKLHGVSRRVGRPAA